MPHSSQYAEPSSTATYPSPQGEHESSSKARACPTVQATQAVPSEFLAYPGLHGEHELEPGSERPRSPHSVHLETPPRE